MWDYSLPGHLGIERMMLWDSLPKVQSRLQVRILAERIPWARTGALVFCAAERVEACQVLSQPLFLGLAGTTGIAEPGIAKYVIPDSSRDKNGFG